MDIEERIKSAEECEKELRWKDAAKVYLELISENPNRDFYAKAGWCLSRNGNYDEAKKWFNKLIEVDSNNPKWHYMLGYQYYSIKAWEEAIFHFENALSLNPNYFVVKYRLAYAYIQVAGSYKQLTKPAFWKAISQLEECHDIWNSYSEHQKRMEKDTYFDVNFLHGKVLMNLSNYLNKAIMCFENALKIKKDDICQYNLARCYYLASRYKEALDILPNSNAFYVEELKAYIMGKLEHYDEAIEIIKKVLKTKPKDYLFRTLSEICIICKEFEQAYVYAMDAISIGKNNHKNHFTMAKVYYYFGLYQKCLNEINISQQIKNQKYSTDYVECIELKNIVVDKINGDYQDNKDVIVKLEKLINKRMGRIKRYDIKKGYGFIETEGKSIFFHISNCFFSDVKQGCRVKFKVKNTEKGVQAYEIEKS